MREHPILFSTEMVQAILEGRKTQTRRVVKFGIDNTSSIQQATSIEWDIRRADSRMPSFDTWGPRTAHFLFKEPCKYHDNIIVFALQCPYGQVGDRLWVKETWGYICSVSSFYGTNPEEHYAHIRYIADGENRNIYFATSGDMKAALPKQNIKRPNNFDTLDEFQKEWTMSDLCTNWWKKQKVKPSIFMPRWASRITLEITDIRVERLQDITKEDSLAEGVFDSYSALWDSINGKKHSWESNPWVWVIEFKKI